MRLRPSLELSVPLRQISMQGGAVVARHKTICGIKLQLSSDHCAKLGSWHSGPNSIKYITMLINMVRSLRVIALQSLGTSEQLCNELVGQAFQPDADIPGAIKLGKRRQ